MLHPNIDENVVLIVGIVSDEDAESYKRLPIICYEDRLEIIKSIKYVDKIIEKCPLTVTEEFLNDNKIDLVVHGFSNSDDCKNQEIFFKDVVNLKKFRRIEYYNKTSTSKIIDTILSKNKN